jgi:hypothetical protein
LLRRDDLVKPLQDALAEFLTLKTVGTGTTRINSGSQSSLGSKHANDLHSEFGWGSNG